MFRSLYEVTGDIKDINTFLVPSGVVNYYKAIDGELVASHLGVAQQYDSLKTAQKKINELICWSIEVDKTLNRKEADVWHQGSESFYRAILLHKIPVEELVNPDDYVMQY